MLNLDRASVAELTELIETKAEALEKEIFDTAAGIRREKFGNRVYLRGLIEITSYCVNDCYYCGLRRSNEKAVRYRLSDEQISDCCETGYKLGFRTFVLQGGEDGCDNDERLCGLLGVIKQRYPDAAVTLSLGERSRESYARLKAAGADRYLLRHETADEGHYNRIHPMELSAKERQKSLYELKSLGFQTGAGFMVGSPFQTVENLAKDLVFLRELKPHMVGIGPFLPHKDTPFGSYPPGSGDLTLRMIALTRILLPDANIPSTTALASLMTLGREKGLMCGANVTMPNLSPPDVRGAYNLYDGKLSRGAESAEGLAALKNQLLAAGFEADMGRGDAKI